MRSILLVGGVGAGKTTFRQQLQGHPLEYAKTQSIETFGTAIDTPGEYLELGRFKHALMLAAYDVDVVVLVQSAICDETRYPPGFATTFNREVLGVVTKIDLASKQQIEAAVNQLKLAGAHIIVAVDSLTGEGFDRVREALCRTSS